VFEKKRRKLQVYEYECHIRNVEYKIGGCLAKPLGAVHPLVPGVDDPRLEWGLDLT
jgi:hypothetical protein